MNILSIDVGIKHLAYCFLSVNKEKKYKIEGWNVVDLCNSKKYICTSFQKNKKKCTNNAKFKKNGFFFCKKHAKISEYKIPTQELQIKKIKKLTILKLKNLCKKYDISFCYDKSKRNSYKTQIINAINCELLTKYLDNIKISNINANNFSLVNLGINLKKKFEELLDHKFIDIVVIENQIGPLALRMKSLQGMIMQHFIENNIQNIIEVSSNNKLKEFIKKKKTTYSERKKISIQITRQFLENNNELICWLNEFNTNKKRDDLADCFLQGLWYIKKKLDFNLSPV